MILSDGSLRRAILERATKHYTVVIKPLMTTYGLPLAALGYRWLPHQLPLGAAECIVIQIFSEFL